MEISNMLLEDLYLIFDSLEKEFDEFWNANILKSELEKENTRYIVAKIDGKIVGFAGIFMGVDFIEIMNIVVKKNNRKIGIGGCLLKELISISQKTDKEILTLEVNVNNLPAIKLYEKFGFKEVGRRKKYYNNQDDALIMNLKL